jgi:hypothetical protein
VRFVCIDLANAITALQTCTPAAVICPACYPRTDKRDCLVCRGTGFATAMGLTRTPSEKIEALQQAYGVENSPYKGGC